MMPAIDGASAAPLDGVPMRAVRILWTAVLARAITDALGIATGAQKGTAGRVVERHARAWLSASNPDFRLVCELAGYDPAYVQRRLPAMEQAETDARRHTTAATRVRAARNGMWR